MSSLIVKFANQSGVDQSSVWIGFVPGSSGDVFSIINQKDQSALNPLNTGSATYPFDGNWYSLAQLSEGVAVSSFSGRIYVAYGQSWSVQYAGYEPAQAVVDPNFFLRYDKMEMTFTGDPNDVANLTSIDYWSIPMSLTTYYQGQAVAGVKGLLPKVTAQHLFDALSRLTTPPVSGVAGPGGIDGVPLPALVPGQFAQYPKGPTPGTSFARIIGPSSYPPINPPPSAVPVTPYDTFQNYLNNLFDLFGPGTEAGSLIPGLGNGVIATIAGQFAGVGKNPPSTGPSSPQSYNLSATIDENLDITLTGTLSSVAGTTTILYKNADLTNPSGIYGGNAPYYLNGASTATNPGNDVYGWIGGDLFSGMNIGAVGSPTTVGSVPGLPSPVMVGSLSSQQWFKIPNSFFFSELGAYHNRWAATLAPLSQAYNFAYSDRFAAVFVSLNPAIVDTLAVTLEPASVDMEQQTSAGASLKSTVATS